MTQKQYFYGTWFICFISAFAVAPLMQTINILSGNTPLQLNATFWIWATIDGFVSNGLAVFFGMKFAQKIGAKFLFLSHNINWKKDFFIPGILCGTILALVQLLIDYIVPTGHLTFWFLLTHIPVWQGLLAAIFGILNQEVMLELIWVSGIALVLKKICKPTSISIIMPVSICIASFIFAAMHVPLFVHEWSSVVSFLTFKIMIGNVIAGIFFGMLFWKKGFETAVVAHCMADFILYVGVPALCLMVH